MMVCDTCKSVMLKTISFSNSGNYKFYRCPKCKEETRHQKLKNEELTFETKHRK